MCDICDGKTIEEVRQGTHQNVLRHGFTKVAVGDHGRGWVYTIGLLDNYVHPELVVVGELSEAAWVVEELAQRVLTGERLTPGGTVHLDGLDLAVVPVHPAHFARGLLNAWLDYYREAGRWELEPEALQVVVPDHAHCAEHQPLHMRLDDPRCVPYMGGNRRARRARQREARRRRPTT